MTPTLQELTSKMERVEQQCEYLRGKIEETREVQARYVAVSEQLSQSISNLRDSIRSLRDDQKWAYRFAIGTAIGVMVNIVLLLYKT